MTIKVEMLVELNIDLITYQFHKLPVVQVTTVAFLALELTNV